MKATELRVGNWFIDYETEPELTIYWQVEQIYRPTYGTNLGVAYRDGSSWTSLDILEPIPLTEEWLLKFGFESNPYEDRYEKGEIYVECNKTKGFTELWLSGFPHIKHVHQLQNLYFALTGEELIIK